MDQYALNPILDKYSISENEVLEISDLILANSLIIKYNYIPKDLNNIDDKLKFISNSINWEIDLEEHTNMGMLHLHALEPISYLLLAYNYTSNEEYLSKSFEILFDWYDHSKNSTHFYLWYRHCVAERAVVISQLYLLKDYMSLSRSEEEKFYNIVLEHRNYLTKNENYVLHNHGTLMDIGLISLSLVIQDKLSLSYSINRLRDNFTKTFTNNMVCVENSISYSVYNIEQFIKCEKYLLRPIQETLTAEFDEKMYQALDFLNLIKQPNDAYPHLGDGEKIDLDFLKSLHLYKFYSSHPLFHKEDNLSHSYIKKVYIDEGYAIIKNQKNYIFVTAGDVKKNHKHADDLSFVLYLDGEVFIDPGIYSYENNNLRKYLTSSMAHNTIVINQESYGHINNTSEDALILVFEELNDYFYISMRNKSYPNAIIYRHLYIFKEDFTILIKDEVISREKLLVTQIFNLSPELSNAKKIILDDRIIIDDKYLLQYNEHNFCEIMNGKNPLNVNAMYSEKFHEKKPIIKLGINSYDKSPFFETVISANLTKNYSIFEESNEKDIIKFKSEDKVFKLQKLNVEEDALIQMEEKPFLEANKVGETLFAQTLASYYKNQEYAWDILRNGQKEKLIWYQDSNKFEYPLKKEGVYTIRCYVRNKENINEKKSFLSTIKIEV